MEHEYKEKGLLEILEKKVNKNPKKIIHTLVIVLLAIFLVNFFLIFSSNSTLNSKAGDILEAKKPVKIGLTIIDCEECSDISALVDGIKNQNVEITDETTLTQDSSEAADLIHRYNIEKLPSVLISGEIDSEKVHFGDFKLNGDSLILSSVAAPYFDIASSELKGKVDIIEIVDSSCDKCASLSSIPLSLTSSGVAVSNWDKVEYNSVEGKDLTTKYGITEIPALLISDDINYYEAQKQSLIQLGSSENQGYYKLHAILPPYRDLAKNKVVGLVDLVMLTDSSCTDCYDVNVNKQILQGLGVTINTENTYDITSVKGKELISKYTVKKVPIILLSPEAKEYANFVGAWQQVGSVESDGWYVMRSPDVIGKIKEI